MTKPKELPKKTYQSRDEIEQNFFLKGSKKERLESDKSEASKIINEETIRQIQLLFRAN